MKYSNSYIQSFKNCPLQCFYQYELGLEKLEPGKEEHHRTYGRAIHLALKELYLGNSFENSKKVFLTAYPSQLDPEDMAKTQSNGIVALEAYYKRYLKDDFEKWKILSCEEKETFDYGQQEDFTVMCDLVIENKAYGGIYGVDHKIVGGQRAALSYQFWNQFNPNSQITKYCSFIKSKYGDCSGFYINAIGLGFRTRAYKGEPPGFWYRMERIMFNRSEAELLKEQEDTRYWIDRIEDTKSKNHWGMNTNSCLFCSYNPICSAGWFWPEEEELILQKYSIKKAHKTSEKEDLNAARNGTSEVHTEV